MRLHMSQVYVCTAQGCGAVREGKRLFVYPVCCFVAGALRGLTRKDGSLPSLRVNLTQSPHRPTGPTSWAPVQRESRTVRPISLAFLGVQQTVGRQSTRATPWIARRLAIFSPRARASTPYSTPALLASRPPLAVLRLPHQTPALLASRPPLVVLRPSLKAPLAPRGSKMRALSSAGIRARSSPFPKD